MKQQTLANSKLVQSSARWGFTLIEVVLVLAISSFLAILLIGLYGNQQGRAQFADATESVVSKLQSVKSEVTSGFSTGTGTDKNRIFFGKAVVFTDKSNTYKVYTLTADNSEQLTNLALEGSQGETVTLPWGAYFEDAEEDKATVVFTRNLSNAQLATYIFTSAMSLTTATNYADQYKDQATLHLVRDLNDPNAYRSDIVVDAISAHIKSSYAN